MGGHGHDFGHGLGHVHEIFWTSDTGSDTDSDTDSDKVMTLDTDMGSDKGMSEKLGHEFGLGQLSDTRVRPTLPCTPNFVVFFQNRSRGT